MLCAELSRGRRAEGERFLLPVEIDDHSFWGCHPSRVCKHPDRVGEVVEVDAEEDDVRAAAAENDLLGHPAMEDDVVEPLSKRLLLQEIEGLRIDIDPADAAVRPDHPRCREREEPLPAPDVDEGRAGFDPDPFEDGLGVLPPPPCGVILGEVSAGMRMFRHTRSRGVHPT